MTMRATILSRIANGRLAVPALLAAVLGLGGCGATHVGDAWQCPLAQGAACTSVAEADPAVRSSGKAQGHADRGPAPRAERAHSGESGASCVGSCDPLAWLGDWFRTLEDDVGLAERAVVSPDRELPDGSADGLRTREWIARIWIAPFVDAEGVYREGHWVRAVLEPARWRLP